jgi:hypothetical protein
MKNTIIRLMVVVLMMGFVVLPCQYVMAEEGMATDEVAAVEAAVPEVAVQATAVAGKLVAVDLEKSTITVEQAMGENEGVNTVVLTADASTAIMKAGAPVTLGDLAAGDMVTAEGTIDDMGNLVASSISVE